MVTGIELGALALALVFLLVAVWVLQALRPLIVNAVVGLLVFLVAGWLGVPVEVDWVTVLIVAIGGFPAAVLVVLLAAFHLAFVPGLVLPTFLG